MANGTRKGRPLNSKGKQPVGKTANSRTAINQRIEEEDRRAMERRQQAKSRRASRFLERNDEEDDTDAEE